MNCNENQATCCYVGARVPLNLCVFTLLSELIKELSFMYLGRSLKKMYLLLGMYGNSSCRTGSLRPACQWTTCHFSCGISFTWSGNVVSLSSRSSSAYVKIVFRERRKNSSLKFWDVPTRDERDMVTCIFTLAKFCNREIVTAFQQPGDTQQSAATSVLWSLYPPPDTHTKKNNNKLFLWKGLSQYSD